MRFMDVEAAAAAFFMSVSVRNHGFDLVLEIMIFVTGCEEDTRRGGLGH